MTGIPERTKNIFLLFRDHWSFLRRTLAVRAQNPPTGLAFRVRFESLNSKQKQMNYNITGSNKCDGFGCTCGTHLGVCVATTSQTKFVPIR